MHYSVNVIYVEIIFDFGDHLNIFDGPFYIIWWTLKQIFVVIFSTYFVYIGMQIIVETNVNDKNTYSMNLRHVYI